MVQRPAIPWFSVAQFVFSGLALVALLGLGMGLAIAAVAGRLQGNLPSGDETSLLLRAAGILFCGLLMLPSGVLALLRILDRPLPFQTGLTARRVPLLAALFLVWVLALLAGMVVSDQPQLSPVLMPPLFVVIVAAPVAWFLLLGMGGLPGGSLQRRWGVFTASLAGNTLLVIVVELLVMAALAVVAVIVIASRPEWVNEMNRLAQRLSTARPTAENFTRILRPYLTQPWVLYAILVFYSGIAPLVEELLKPLPVWLLAGRRLTPAEGFVTGLVSGAGFALFESLGMLAVAQGSAWLPIAVARSGSDLLHILNTGLMGWALASAWGEGRFGRLMLTYLGVVLVHGSWNALSVVFGFLPVLGAGTGLQVLAKWPIGEAGLGVLSLIMLLILLRTNRSLRRDQPLAPTPEFGS